MKYDKFLGFGLALALMCPSLPGISFAAETGKSQTIVRCGEQPSVQGSEKFFTGRARITPLYPAANGMRSSGGSVTFEPGARSNWHVHPVGQVLIVTDGVGRTQEWGGPVREIRAGDVIICPAGVKHWHGASPATAMTHISVCEENEPGRVVDWMEAVTDEQYAGK